MDKYRKVEEKRSPEIPTDANEIRITSQGLVSTYFSIATTLLQYGGKTEVTLKGMGQAIGKTVTIAEIVKRHIPQLHQKTEIRSVVITDVWEPIEEGLLVVEKTRNVSMISITLSIKELNKTSPGYQAPFLVEPKAQYNNNNYHRQQQPNRYNSVNEGSYGGKYEEMRGPRGGGGRGHRGGYGNCRGGQNRNYHSVNNQYDKVENNGYGNQGGGGGRGRGGNAFHRGDGYSGRGGGGYGGGGWGRMRK